MNRFSTTERIGVNKVEELFLHLGWIPRTVFQTDVGIDMIVEICENGNPIGKFIGVQIKTGKSYFSEEKDESIIFRSGKSHIEYWLNNSLPIIIVLHNPDSGETLWQRIEEDTVINTGKNYKIELPKSQIFNEGVSTELKKLSPHPPLLNKFQRLLLDKPIIDKLNEDQKIVIELRSWVNKSSGRADIKLYEVIQDPDYMTDTNLEQILLEEATVIGVYSHQALYNIYPFSDFKTDETFYENYEDYNEDNPPGYKIKFIEDRFHDYELPIIPYEENGETASYRIIMELNEFGHSFLNFYEFINGDKQLKLKF